MITTLSVLMTMVAAWRWLRVPGFSILFDTPDPDGRRKRPLTIWAITATVAAALMSGFAFGDGTLAWTSSLVAVGMVVGFVLLAGLMTAAFLAWAVLNWDGR